VIDSPSELVMHEGRSQREGLLVVADTAFAALPEVPSLLWWASAVQPSSPSGACVCDGAASAINQVSTDNEYKYAGHVVTLPAGSVDGLPHELANATLGAVALRLPVGAYLLCVARNEPNVYRANAYTLYSATLFVLPPPPPPPPPPPSSPPAPLLVSGTPSLPPRVESPMRTTHSAGARLRILQTRRAARAQIVVKVHRHRRASLGAILSPSLVACSEG